MSISEERLLELEQLTNQATDGPWDWDRGREDFIVFDCDDDVEICEPHTRYDAAFICAAREAVPELIAEVRMLRVLINGYRQLALNLTKKMKLYNKEAKWLAEKLHDVSCGNLIHCEIYADDWRMKAQKAVSDD